MKNFIKKSIVKTSVNSTKACTTFAHEPKQPKSLK